MIDSKLLSTSQSNTMHLLIQSSYTGNSHAKFRHVSVAATNIIRKDNTRNQTTLLLECVYLVMHTSLYFVSLLQHNCLCYTSHICTCVSCCLRWWQWWPPLKHVGV